MKPKRGKKRISLGRDLDRPKWKMSVIGAFVLVLFALVCFKAFELQVIDRDRAFKVARKQHHGSSTLLPRRGKILDRNMKELAVNVEIKSVFVNPYNIKNPEEFSKALSGKLEIPEKKLLKRASSKSSFVWLKRLVDPAVTSELESMDIEGLGYIEEPKRVYPNGPLMGQVLGFTNIDSTGIEGLEYRYDSLLIGKPGKIILKRDAYGRRIINNPDIVESFGEEKTSGHSIVLTIDSQIQHIVERELKDGIEKMSGEKGMAILMDPESGEVLAMASYPFLDPNNYGEYPQENRRNLPIWYTYEPGSTMKVFLVASAIQDKKASPESQFFCENGRRKVGARVIRDVKPYGTLTLADIVRVSSNIGASKVGELLGKETYYQYLKKFGFGEKSGIDLPGESSGKLLSPKKWGKIELATISFGQGVSVTSLQLVSALSAIANGGYLMKPHIVKRIISSDGTVIREKKPEVVNRVLSYDTSVKMTRILERVVEEGTGKKAAIPGFTVGGKTGTAQIPDPVNGGYYNDRFIASFIGFAPTDDPKIVLAVVVEAPKKMTHGGSVAAPIFRQVAEKVLFHLGASPNKEMVGTRIMPDLSGKSVRDILKWSEEEGIKVEVKGSGYVTGQQPPPGDTIKEGMVCSIELKQNI
ncbi:MAG: penicillin-binding transpeptidase domain-containing protein [Deltaproteobacteria bacterium]